MTRDGQRYAAELTRLEARKKELEDALGRLARDEAEAREVAELAQEVERLKQEVESSRATTAKESDMTKNEPANSADGVRKAAADNRQAVDAELDKLARTMQADGETFEKAYDRMLQTEMGRALLRTRDDAHAIATGGPTEADLEAARKNLTA
ncbi:MAG: hypothetical protein JJU07_16430 [Natronohydrobacter sp.]|nr:hypothetical protein [Natronohydrobacter sp.]